MEDEDEEEEGNCEETPVGWKWEVSAVPELGLIYFRWGIGVYLSSQFEAPGMSSKKMRS